MDDKTNYKYNVHILQWLMLFAKISQLL